MNNWKNNKIQFPRLIAELQYAGAFTDEVMSDLQESMDLSADEINELIDRAEAAWDDVKYSN